MRLRDRIMVLALRFATALGGALASFLALLCIACLVVMCAGCAPSPLQTFAASGARVVTEAEPRLLAAYQREQGLCFASGPRETWDPCVAKVREDWATLQKKLADYRAAWCAFEPQKCPAAAKAVK